jgi:DNA-binding LacI/PurR family transcriptional regulator
VWHVSGPPDWFDSAGRLRGWQEALLRAGAELPPPLAADWSASSGYQAGLMLARMPEVTAIFAANDHLALGILRAMYERGRNVPHDVSVVGFDDVPEAAYFIPPLTTVRPDFDEVARETLELLLAQVGDSDVRDTQRTIAPTLVMRNSVATPPA